MNERIRELAVLAEFSEKDLHIQGDNFQKFAELIIRECADLVDDHDDSYPYVSFGDMIKEHFGIE